MSPGKPPYYVALILSLLVCSDGLAFEQTAKSSNLTRDDVVLRRNKPSIYMCVTRESQGKEKGREDEVWLRIYNNTIWLIRFNAERMGTPLKAVKLSNGSNVAALTNGAMSFPRYQFEPKDAGNRLSGSLWGGVSTRSWLPSNSYSAFKVPKKNFNEGNLYLEFNYEWEIIGTAGVESYAPTHRIYFAFDGASETTDMVCD